MLRLRWIGEYVVKNDVRKMWITSGYFKPDG